MSDDVPQWAAKLIDTVSDLKEQTKQNCSKLDILTTNVTTIQTDLKGLAESHSQLYERVGKNDHTYRVLLNRLCGHFGVSTKD